VGRLEDLLSGLRETCAGLPDKRRGKNSHYAMADIGMAAFSVFFMQSPSFLAHQRQLAEGHGHGRSNCETLFGMTRIPSDNHVRDMLDPVPPECFDARSPHAVEVLEAGGGLGAFRRLDHHMLIAFDGPEYFRSAKLHCPRCSTRKRSGGTIEYFHNLMAATLVAPGHNRVVPLQPEFVVPQDGHDKSQQHLSAVLAILNLLAFAFHTVADLTHDLWLQAVNKAGARSRFFERLRVITVLLVLPSWHDLLTTLAFAQPPSQPP
jgi:hypothetical protein